MTDIILQNMDYLQLLYAFGYLLIGLMAAILYGSNKSEKIWWWITLFGFVYFLKEIITGISMYVANPRELKILTSIATVVAFLALLEGGRKQIVDRVGPILGRWIFIPILAIIFVGGRLWGISGALAFSKYFCGILGGVAVVFALHALGKARGADSNGPLKNMMIIVGLYAISQVIVEPAQFFPASLINEALFLKIMRVPIHLLRTLLTLGWAVCLYLHFHATGPYASIRLRTRQKILLIIIFMITVVFGWAIVNRIGDTAARDLKLDFIRNTNIAKVMINPERINNLKGLPSDIGSPDYDRLKEQLVKTRSLETRWRNIYLMGVRDGKVIFYVDSELVGSRYYVAPGDVWNGSPGEVTACLNTGKGYVVGPYMDRWGSWMSCFVPITDFHSPENPVLAVLGMDIDNAVWEHEIFAHRAQGLWVVSWIFLLLLTLFILTERGEAARQAIRRSEEHYRLLAENINDIVWIINFDAKLTYVSPSALHQLGYTDAEAIAMPLSGFFTPASTRVAIAKLTEIVEEIRRENDYLGSSTLELEYVRKDNSTMWGELSFKPLRDSSGRATAILGVTRDITERREVESAMQGSEEKFRTLANFTLDWEYWYGPDGKYLYISPACERITGYSPEELTADPGLIERMTHPDDRAIVSRHTDAALDESLSATSFDYRIITRDGRTLWISHRCRPVFNINGKFIGRRGNNRDVTGQKMLERAIKNNERKLRAIFDGSVELVGLTTTDGILLDVNRTALKLSGVEEESVLNKPFWEGPWWKHSPELQMRLRQSIKRAAQGETIRFEATHPAADGTTHYIDFSIKPVMDEKGKAIFLIPEGHDITERKAMENKIRNASEEWQHTFDAIPDFIFIMDSESRIVKVNKAFADAYSSKNREYIGRKCYEILHGKAERWTTCPVPEMIEKMRTNTVEVDDPTIGVPLLVSASPVCDEYGKLTGIVHVARDISKVKAAEKAMQDALNIKSQFISMASHELRTPLTAIKESIGIVSEGAADKLDDEMKDFLGLAKRNIDRLARLINDILDFQKLEAGRVEFRMQELEINDLLKEVRASMAPLAKQKGLEFSILLAENLPLIKFDKDKITQVLINLINNAIKFTDKGSIMLTTKHDQNTIVVCVSDTGPGIQKDDMAKLFQKFQQLGSVNERKPGGTGLGLAISKQIIEQHGGKIWVESEPGVGTKFCFLLPIHERRTSLV